jgi:hypothetical protein
VCDCIGRFRRSAILFPGTVHRNKKSEHVTTCRDPHEPALGAGSPHPSCLNWTLSSGTHVLLQTTTGVIMSVNVYRDRSDLLKKREYFVLCSNVLSDCLMCG